MSTEGDFRHRFETAEQGDTPKTGRIRPYSHTLVELSRVADMLLIFVSLWLAGKWLGMDWSHHSSVLAFSASLAFSVAGTFMMLYRSWRLDRLHTEFARIFACWGIAFAITGCLAYLINYISVFPRTLALVWFVAALMTLSAPRICIRGFLRVIRVKGHNYRRVAIVGASHTALRVAETINRAPWMGLRLAGFYDDRDPTSRRIPAAVKHQIRGKISDLVHCAEAGDIDCVYIALPLRAEVRIKELIDCLAETPASVAYVPDFFAFNLLHAHWDHIGSMNVVNVVTTPFLGVSGLAKRIEDIVLASLILPTIAIPLLLIAISVKLTSPGPAIFRQRRYGLNGKEFEIWKFRTMTVCEDGAEAVQATSNDIRITSIGRFLRRTSLDELPQFINVLQGTMSVVGPRPHPMALDDEHRLQIPRYVLRHKIRPGISGWAQVNGFRGETDTLDKMSKRLQYDLEYIDQWSLGLDLKIIFLSVMRGFTDKNAY